MLGSKLRSLRKKRDMTQIELADKLGISASYLNLIEHNRRTLTVPLLLRLSQILNVDPQEFAPRQDNRLVSEISDSLKDPLFKDVELSEEDIGQMVLDAPGLCQAVTKAYGAYRNTQNDLHLLSERLAQDPVLSNASYRLRTLITSIRSFAEILHDNEDLDATERRTFLKIMSEESLDLSQVADSLIDNFSGDKLLDLATGATPDEAVTDFLQSKGNFFAELEDAAHELRQGAGLEGVSPNTRLIGYLQEHHGVTIEFRSAEQSDTSASLYNEAARTLILSKALPPSSINFHLAILICSLSYEPLLDSLTDTPALPDAASRTKAKAALANYFAGATILPYDRYLKAAQDCRYDIEILQQQFGVSYEQACHRLTTLRKPGAEGIPLHFIRVDCAGNISKRFSASGLRIPRYGSACPRWVMHTAFMTPGLIRQQIAEMPDGTRYFTVARTVTKPSHGHGQPKGYYVVSIGCELREARHMVYADGLNLEEPAPVVEVGAACRLCDKPSCAQRAAPPPQQPQAPGSGRNISPGVGVY